MKLIYLLVAGIFLSNCTHVVHKLDVEQSVTDSISEEAKVNCGDRCKVNKCWWENKDVLICNVEFSFVTDMDKVKVLEATSANLAKKNLQVGFCGTDSFGTSMAAAFIGGMAGGALSHATGGSTQAGAMVGGIAASSDISEKVFINKELVQKACGTTPIEEF